METIATLELASLDELAAQQEARARQEAAQSQQEPSAQPQYWAAKPADDCVAELRRLERRYYDFVQRRGFGQAWMAAYCTYYGLDADAMSWDAMQITIDQHSDGELLRWRCNEARSYLQQTMHLASGQRPRFKAVARTTDHATLAAIESKDAQINALYEVACGERAERETYELGKLCGVSYSFVGFDPDAQRPLVQPVAPWDTFCDPCVTREEDHLWRCHRERISRHELAGMYPAHRDAILAFNSSAEPLSQSLFGFDAELMRSSDAVVVKHFFHRRSKAMPVGRYIMFLGDTPLHDDPLGNPYEDLPYETFMPARYIGTALGYADFWDTLPLMQMQDALLSDAASVIAQLGRPLIAYERSSVSSVIEALSNGYRLLPMSAGASPPQIVQGGELPQSWGTLMTIINSKMQSVTRLNETARGQSSTNIKSGEMAALYHSIAIEANSHEQLAVDQHRKGVANRLLRISQTMLSSSVAIRLAGSDERTYVGELTRDSVSGIDSVTMETENPMLRTPSGRRDFLQLVMQLPEVVLTPQEALEFVVSGQMKSVYKAPRSQLLRVAWENEALRAGPATSARMDAAGAQQQEVGTVPVLLTDNDQLHILEHATEIASPAALESPAVMQAVTAHIAAHMTSWIGKGPALCAALKQSPPPSAGPPPSPSGAPSGAKGGEHSPPQTRDPNTGTRLPKPAEPPPESQVQP